ncbi:hypothetical protein BpHYR1_037119, partial [Brachionus plicatilis]
MSPPNLNLESSVSQSLFDELFAHSIQMMGHSKKKLFSHPKSVQFKKKIIFHSKTSHYKRIFLLFKEKKYYFFIQKLSITVHFIKKRIDKNTNRMQGDYYNFSQGPATGTANGYAAYGGYMPYGYPLPAPTVVNNKPLEKIKRQKQRSADGRKHQMASNSTDESIHLVRSRKTGESAPSRYDSDGKKRSHSGNSLAQQAAQLSSDDAHLRQRSHSDPRS